MKAVLASLLLTATAFSAQFCMAATAVIAGIESIDGVVIASADSDVDVDAGTATTNQNHVLRVFFTTEGRLVIKGDVTPKHVNADPKQLATTLRQMAAPGAYIYLWGNNAKSYAEIEQVQHQIQLARKLIEPPKGEL